MYGEGIGGTNREQVKRWNEWVGGTMAVHIWVPWLYEAVRKGPREREPLLTAGPATIQSLRVNILGEFLVILANNASTGSRPQPGGVLFPFPYFEDRLLAFCG